MKRFISILISLCLVLGLCTMTAFAQAPEGDSPAGESVEAPAEGGDSAEAPAEGGDSAEAPAEGGDSAEAPAEGGDSAGDSAEAPAEGGDSAGDSAGGGESTGDSAALDGNTAESSGTIITLEPETMDELIIGPEGYEFTTDVYTGKLEIDPAAEITSQYPIIVFFEESESVENGTIIGNVQFVSDYDEVVAVVHTNDVHGHLTVEPYVKGLADEMKASGDYSLVLTVSAGDVFGGGEAVAGAYRGEFIPALMDKYYDVLVPGNNDYTINGYARQDILLSRLFENTQFLCANAITQESGLAMGEYIDTYEASIGNELFDELYEKVTTKEDGSLDLSALDLQDMGGSEEIYQHTAVFTTDNGTAIGVFGITDNGGAVDKELASTGSIVNAQASVDALRAEGIKTVIGVGHTGWMGEESTGVSTNDTNSWQLANSVLGLDAYIDAHTHSIINDGQGVLVGTDPTFVNQAECFGECIGVAYFYLKDGEVLAVDGNVINDMEGITPDAEIQEYVDMAEAKVKEDFGKPIAYTDYFLNAERLTANNEGGSARGNETNLGDLITDVLKDALSNYMGVDYDFVSYPGYWLRASVEPGDITLETIQSIFANPTVLYYDTYTGEQVLNMVTNGLANVYPEKDGQSFNQYSGIEVTYIYNEGGTGTPVTIKVGDTLVYDAANGGLQVGEDWTCEGVLTMTGGEIDSYTGDMANWICTCKEDVQQLVGDWFQNHTADDYTIYPNTVAPGGRIVEVEG